MASQVEICNLALAALGKDGISSLTEASTAARYCSLFWKPMLDSLLQSYPWGFAGKTQSLAEVANDKPGQWLYAYSKPSGCLKIRYVAPDYSEGEALLLTKKQEFAHPYAVEGQVIYCNLSPAYLVFTRRVTDASLFPPMFVDAIWAHLSARLAMPMTRDPAVRRQAYADAAAMMAQAQMADANDEPETSDHTADAVEARF
ncbi:hypothetical protein [Breoghania sp.]|uniref:hypothetical protein n=1 Tax=Breoghania sp. TaxID=2065378 RepID=UPI002AA7147C|nr:hypothetical protein [Breoghania sp.]